MAAEDVLQNEPAHDALRNLENRIKTFESRLSHAESTLRNLSTRLSLAEIFLGVKALTIHVIGPSFTSGEGVSWIYDLPNLADRASNNSAPHRSVLVVCEDGRPLGPGNAVHEDIRTKGQGRYSHWDQYLLFSTSDNTDPNLNGRQYEIVIQEDG